MDGKQILVDIKTDEWLHRVIVKIEPKSVFFLRFILEAYDNEFILTTLDTEAGIVEIKAVPESIDDLKQILNEVASFVNPLGDT